MRRAMGVARLVWGSWAFRAAGVLVTATWLYYRAVRSYRVSAVGAAMEEAMAVLQGHLQPEVDKLQTASVGVRVVAFGIAVSLFGFPPAELAASPTPPQPLPPSTLVGAGRLMRFASASYGPALINDVFFPGHGMSALATELLAADPDGAARAAIIQHTGVALADIVAVDLPGSDLDGAFRPAYFLAIDRAAARVVLSIRGTMTVQDAMVDLLADAEPLSSEDSGVRGGRASGSVHRGMARLAKALLESTAGTIIDILQRKRAKSLVVVGHSLGAGAAVIYTLLFRRRYPGVDVHCHAFACPAIASARVWETESAEGITAYVLQDDIVPRLSLDSVAHFQRVHVWLTAHERAFRQIPVMAPAGASRHLRFLVTAKFRRAVTLLPPPGVVHLTAGTIDCPGTVARVMTPERFSQLLFSARMLTDHLPWQYEIAFAAAVAVRDTGTPMCHSHAQDDIPPAGLSEDMGTEAGDGLVAATRMHQH